MAADGLSFPTDQRTDPSMVAALDPAAIQIAWNSVKSSAWDLQADSADFLPLQQSWAFGQTVARHGGAVHQAVVTHEGSTVALAQALVRRLPAVQLVTFMMGPLWVDPSVDDETRNAVLGELAQTVPEKGPRLVLAMPPDAAGADSAHGAFHRVVSPYHTSLIDLDGSEEAIRAGFKSKWRNRLKAAEAGPLRLSPLGRSPDQYGWLLDAARRDAHARRYTALSPGWIPTYAEASGRDGILALEAKDRAERVGGCLFLRHGKTATYQIGWSNEAGRKAGAPALLLWEGIKRLRRKGVQVLDLGGLDTDTAPGVARFKLGLGGRVHSQPGTFLLSPRLR